MAEKNARFFPYQVIVYPPGHENGVSGKWSVDWYGREYEPLHHAPIALSRKPFNSVLQACSYESKLHTDDSGALWLWLYNDGFGRMWRPGSDGDAPWLEYTTRLRKLLVHLKPYGGGPRPQRPSLQRSAAAPFRLTVDP